MRPQRLAAKATDDGVIVRLPWLQLTVAPGQGKGIVEFKAIATTRGGVQTATCRFCEVDLTAGNKSTAFLGTPAFEKLCSSEDCRALALRSCDKMLGCGHPCCGVRDEPECLPCLFGCGDGKVDGDMNCGICYLEALARQPTIQLGCGHAFHADCLHQLISAGYSGAQIAFGFLGCPSCRVRACR